MVSLLCYAGLQLESAKRLVTAARKVVFEHGVIVVLCRIAAGECKTPCNSCEKGSFLNMVSLLCYAGLQLESAKRLVTAARKVVFEHGVIVVLCRIAAGECKTPCNSCEKGSF